MKKRLLTFIETGGPGGAERVALDLLLGFRERGFEVALATLRTGWLTENATKNGIEYFRIISERGLDIGLPFRIAQVCRAFGADVLHTHLLDSNFYGSLASKIARIRHVGTEHGDVHHLDAKKLLRLKLKIASSGQSQLTAVSQFSANKLLSLGVAKVTVIPNPLPAVPKIANTDRLKKELGLTSNWIWCHVGNLRPVKDQATLIRGFAKSVATLPDQQLLIVGDGDERQALEALIAKLELQSKVTLLGHRDDVQELLALCDGFVLSSISESMPMALLEAIQAKLYPVCSAVGGIPEILAAEHLFAPQDPDSLAARLTAAASHDSAAREVARQLNATISQTRSLDQILNQYECIYNLA